MLQYVKKLVENKKPKEMTVAEISKALGRGKHTTRHSELIWIEDNTYIMDTPGFTSLYALNIEEQNLKNCYREFNNKNCYFAVFFLTHHKNVLKLVHLTERKRVK